MGPPLSRLLVLLALVSVPAWAQGTPPTASRPPGPQGPYVASPPSAATREGLQLFQEGCQSEDFDEDTCQKAIRRLKEAVREDPRQLEAQLALAKAIWNGAFRLPEGSREREAQRQRSLDLYQQLIDERVGDARPYYELSVVIRDDATRIRLLRRAVELNPKHPEAHKDLAYLLLAQGQVDEAVKEYRTHLSISPYGGREDALEHLRFADMLAERGRIREAAQVLDRVAELTRVESKAERCAIFQSVDLDPYERIGAAFTREVRRLRPYCAGTQRLERARELEQRGQEDAAIQELQRQIEENPLPAEPYLALERLYLEQGKEAEAAEVVTRYFQREQEPREECRHYRTLSPRTVRAMDPALVNALESACRQQQP